MNDQASFIKGFLLAAGLAVVFAAGRASAAPEAKVVDDVSRSLDSLTTEVSRIRRDGVPIQLENKFGKDLKIQVENTWNDQFEVIQKQK